jgi:hypothetical protein
MPEYFDDELALGFTAGPRFNTTVTTFGGGREVRNSNWSQPIRFFTFSKNNCTIEEVAVIDAFFQARMGSAEAFWLKDYSQPGTPYVLVRFAQDELDITVDGPLGAYARISQLTAVEVLDEGT